MTCPHPPESRTIDPEVVVTYVGSSYAVAVEESVFCTLCGERITTDDHAPL